MRFPIPLLLFVLCSVGCNGLVATVPADSEPVEISVRDRVLQELEQLRPLDNHYRGVRDELSQTVKRQQEELDAFLREEHQKLLRSDERMVGLFSTPSDRKLQGLARSLCRMLLTLEAVENYIEELAPVIEHAELWIQLSPPVAGVDQGTSLDTEHLIVVMERLRRDVPKVADVADYQISAVLNNRLDDLRQQVAWNEAEAVNQQQMIQQQLYRREVENQAWANLQRAQVCDWPSIGLEVQCKMIELALGYAPDSREQAYILKYVEGCTKSTHPSNQYGSAKTHIQYAVHVLRNYPHVARLSQ